VSGADTCGCAGYRYIERNKSQNKTLAKEQGGKRHALFRKKDEKKKAAKK
jgi:hypothetical protein